jgi:hypothetical protein
LQIGDLKTIIKDEFQKLRALQQQQNQAILTNLISSSLSLQDLKRKRQFGSIREEGESPNMDLSPSENIIKLRIEDISVASKGQTLMQLPKNFYKPSFSIKESFAAKLKKSFDSESDNPTERIRTQSPKKFKTIDAGVEGDDERETPVKVVKKRGIIKRNSISSMHSRMNDESFKEIEAERRQSLLSLGNSFTRKFKHRFPT